MFPRRVALHPGPRSDCAPSTSVATLERACTAVLGRALPVEEDNGVLLAPRLAWTAYYCALSLHGPADLHPFALRLAARFIAGGDVEKLIIARTVLRWRSPDAEPPGLADPAFALVREAPLALSALHLSAVVNPLTVCLVLTGAAPRILLDPAVPWRERNVALVEARQVPPPLLNNSPPRKLRAHQTFSPQSPYFNNNLATMLAKGFQAMEACEDECPYAFNAWEETFYIQEATGNAWFVVTEGE